MCKPSNKLTSRLTMEHGLIVQITVQSGPGQNRNRKDRRLLTPCYPEYP